MAKAKREAEKIWKDWNLISPPVPIIEIAELFGLTVSAMKTGSVNWRIEQKNKSSICKIAGVGSLGRQKNPNRRKRIFEVD